MSKVTAEFTISRLLDAPRDKVWAAWTQEEQLKQWFGPKSCPIFACKLDLCTTGTFHYGMSTPGGEMWGLWTFREIHAPEKLIHISAFSDKDANTIRAPFSGSWPMETLSMVTFTAEDDKTLVTLRWSALNANEEEETTFENGFDSMTQGWTGTFEQLDAFLAQQ